MTIVDTVSNGDSDLALVDKVLAGASAARCACPDASAHIDMTLVIRCFFAASEPARATRCRLTGKTNLA